MYDLRSVKTGGNCCGVESSSLQTPYGIFAYIPGAIAAESGTPVCDLLLHAFMCVQVAYME